MDSPRVLLLSMPWAQLTLPSIQIGTITPILRRAGADVEPRFLYLEFMDFLSSRGVSVAEYDQLSERSWLTGFGDWLFRLPPLAEGIDAKDEAYLEALRRNAPEFVASGLRIREHIPAFIDACCARITRSAPDVVAFTTTFSQNLASLLLAKRLKAEMPQVTILFGGANCEGPMGVALHRSFPFVDFVVRGEAENALPMLVDVLRGHGDLASIGGLVYRVGGETLVNPPDPGQAVSMDDVPTPDYDAYFAALRESPLRGTIDRHVRLLVESSRGCWWGEKHHCTFCGLNGSSMTFRSKRAERFGAELVALSRTYGRVAFQCVDNILDMRYLNSLLPAIAEARARGEDYTLFYETKANLRKEHVRLMRDAGVAAIQPGIESLSTPLLKQMRKGVTALQNVRLLKWAREYGIRVSWNLIFGFPDEPVEEYRKLYELLPSISHFDRPGLTPLLLERFSPYFEDPDAFGITITGPLEHYRAVYRLPEETLFDLAYDFAYEVRGRTSEPIYEQLHQRIFELWPSRRAAAAARALTHERGFDFVTLRDRRRGLSPQTLTLTDVGARVYLACDAGASRADLLALGEPSERDGIATLLDTLTEKRFLFREDDRYLSLSISKRTSEEAA